MEERAEISEEANTRGCLALLRNPACAVKSRKPRISGQIPRSAATLEAALPVASRTPIPHYPEIETEIYLDSLLEVRR